MSSTGRRIAIVITSLDLAGAQTVLFRYLTREPMHADGILVVTLLENGHYATRLRELGFNVVSVGLRRDLFSFPKGILRLILILRDFKPTALFCWMCHPMLLSVLFLRKGTKVYWYIHHSLDGFTSRKYSTRLVIKACGLLSHFVPSKIAYVSFRALEQHVLIGYPAKKAVCIPNGVDTELFRSDEVARNEIRSELGITKEKLVILSVGRLDREKGPDVLGKVMKLVLAESKVEFIVVGREAGYSFQQVVSGCPEEFLARIHYVGPRADVWRYFAAADILINCSHSEASPTAVLEAMSSGVCCVVTDVGDSRQIIGSCGIVVPPAQPAMLADAIRTIIADDELRREMGVRARQRVIGQYDFEVTRKMIDDLLGC